MMKRKVIGGKGGGIWRSTLEKGPQGEVLEEKEVRECGERQAKKQSLAAK